MSRKRNVDELIESIDKLEERIDDLEDDAVRSSEIKEVVEEYVERITADVERATETKYQVRADVYSEIMDKVEQIVNRDIAEVVNETCQNIENSLLVELARKAMGLEGKK